MMIVVEGLDGAGKSTQVSLLRQYLNENHGSHEYIHFPRYDAPVYGDLISRFLRGEFGDNASVHPRLVALLYAEDRHGAGSVIQKHLDEGKIVLLDRYVYSNVAYQCAKLPTEEQKIEMREWILTTEFEKFAIPRPDINIFLDTPLSFVERQLASHRQGADRSYLGENKDIHEVSISFQESVKNEYLRLCEKDPGFIRIDCSNSHGDMLPADEIFKKIATEVSARIQG